MRVDFTTVSLPQHGFIVAYTPVTIQMLKLHTVRWFSRTWHKITAIAENHGTRPKSRQKPRWSWIRDYSTKQNACNMRVRCITEKDESGGHKGSDNTCICPSSPVAVLSCGRRHQVSDVGHRMI